MGKVTESRGSQKERQKLFSQAGKIAVQATINAGLPLTYSIDNKVIKEYPDGRKEILCTLPKSNIKIEKKFIIK